jgi:hypothetical protein
MERGNRQGKGFITKKGRSPACVLERIQTGGRMRRSIESAC